MSPPLFGLLPRQAHIEAMVVAKTVIVPRAEAVVVAVVEQTVLGGYRSRGAPRKTSARIGPWADRLPPRPPHR